MIISICRSSLELLKDLTNLNKIFRRDVTYDNIKSHNNHKITKNFLSRRFLEKTTEGWGQIKLPPRLLRFKL